MSVRRRHTVQLWRGLSPPLGKIGVGQVVAPVSLRRIGELNVKASPTIEAVAGVARQRGLGADRVRGLAGRTTWMFRLHAVNSGRAVVPSLFSSVHPAFVQVV